ncbi:YgjV family protein [Vibrio methylphosphonaticus]|uniref:YgjV family protein n=1 Tax=Vibrio methylphosphonaticus TaxID=2946866 RepID=UPI002029EC5E|nr:YgjV family protein [Vibrio methylphosphonaticus]MCL9777249.1 YgjV family protein [Vibrio methylphosphonaticus]
MIAAQIVGGIAFLCGVLAFLQKEDLRFRYGMVGFCFIMAIHFVMMDATVAAIGVTVNGIRAFVSIKTQSRWVMWVFIVLLIGVTVPQLSAPIEALTIVGSAVGTWALFSLTGIKMRSVILFNSCCWFIHNLWLGSIGGSLVEGTFIITNLMTIYRMYVAAQSSK